MCYKPSLQLAAPCHLSMFAFVAEILHSAHNIDIQDENPKGDNLKGDNYFILNFNEEYTTSGISLFNCSVRRGG